MLLLKLKFADATEWATKRSLLGNEAQIVEIGQVSHEEVPVTGYLVDAIVLEDIPEVHQYLVNPVQPRHMFYGNTVLAMPETLPEIEQILMITRGIGQTISEEVLARLELAVLRGRLTQEQAADKIALIEANIAIVELRESLGSLKTQRDISVQELQKADAERDRLIALRSIETTKRQAAIDALVGKVGAERTPFIEIRDAANAEIVKLNEHITTEINKVTTEVTNRDSLSIKVEQATDQITSLRAARDLLKGK